MSLVVEDFGERLASLRQDREAMTAFAARCGVGESQIRTYLTGRSGPALKTVLEIAANLGVSAAWLATGEDQPKMLGRFSSQEVAQVSPSGEFDVDGEAYVAIPMLRVEASAGSGAYIQPYNPVAAFTVNASWARQRFRTGPENLSLITARGDSMAPTIEEDDVLLVDLSRAGQPSDGVWVLLDEDLVMVKRVILLPRGRANIVSDNARYPSREVSLANDGIRLIGRVVWRGREFKGGE